MVMTSVSPGNYFKDSQDSGHRPRECTQDCVLAVHAYGAPVARTALLIAMLTAEPGP